MVLYAEDIMRKDCQIVEGNMNTLEGSKIMAFLIILSVGINIKDNKAKKEGLATAKA